MNLLGRRYSFSIPIPWAPLGVLIRNIFFYFMLLCFSQLGIVLFLAATVVGACKNTRLLVQLMLGENEIQASQIPTHLFRIVLIISSGQKLFNERITAETSVQPTSEGERVSGKKRADQPSSLDHQQRWRWRGLQPALSLWLLTSVWWGVIRARGSQQRLCTTGRECVWLHVGQFFTDRPIYYQHTPAVHHCSGLLFAR